MACFLSPLEPKDIHAGHASCKKLGNMSSIISHITPHYRLINCHLYLVIKHWRHWKYMLSATKCHSQREEYYLEHDEWQPSKGSKLAQTVFCRTFSCKRRSVSVSKRFSKSYQWLKASEILCIGLKKCVVFMNGPVFPVELLVNKREHERK
jgi:hypothetical protein